MKPLGNKGQGLIESVLSLPLIVIALSGVFLISYRAVVFYYADYSLHEALVCVDENSPRQCEHDLQKQLNKILLAETNAPRANIWKTAGKVRGYVEIQFPFVRKSFAPPLIIEKQLSFPLRAEKSWKLF